MRKHILLLTVSAALLGACSQVQPGHVGVRVDNLGSNAGVEQTSLGVGYYFTGIGQKIYSYPVYTIPYNWTASKTEGNPVDESFGFQSKEGLGMAADVGISLHVDPAKAPILFQKYRTDLDGILAGAVRNAVRDAIVRRSATYAVDEIYGPKKSELISLAQEDVRRFFAPFGLVIERLYWTSNIELPAQVKGQIEGKIAAEQTALKEQANVAVVEAKARQRIAEAEGKAKANQLESASLTPELLRARTIEKWNGELPKVAGSGTPLINLQ